MTSLPCNKYEQIMPSDLLNVKYRHSNQTLDYHDTIQHSDRCPEFPCYTPEVITFYATDM